MANRAPESQTEANIAKGVSFLWEPVGSRGVGSPERLNEDQKMFAKSAMDFTRHEVLPRINEIEAKKEGVLLDIFKRAAGIGLFAAAVPEEFGGLDCDKTTAVLIAEATGLSGSWAATFGAHTGIGTLPIVFFGTQAQKQKYLPKLATGELIAAYALTENSAGSDALSGRTRADLTSDGKHYVLNGSKMFITNAAFADVFIVFAKVGGDKFTGFIVDRDTPGFSVGPEEHKMGIRGSSTCSLTLEDVKVPTGNLLGEIGKGHKIAFNILNIGREKLGAGCVGTAKYALELSVKYAKDRKQFGKALVEFELIREKLAKMAVGIYAVESASYRNAAMVDARIAKIDKGQPDAGKAIIGAVEEHAVEASSLKVAGSEMLDDVCDHAIQIHGGYGYVEEYQVERLARDCRVNRIFEGTNEINRMLIPGTILKRAMKGEIPLMELAGSVMGELQNPATLPQVPRDGALATARWLTELAKRAVIFGMQSAAQTYMAALGEQQEVLCRLANMVMATYQMDSVVGRALQAEKEDQSRVAVHRDMAELYCNEAYGTVLGEARWLIDSIADGDTWKSLRALLAALPERPAFNPIPYHSRIATMVIENAGYPVA